MVTRKAHRGFSLMEVLVAILIIFTLMGLLIAGIHLVRKSGKSARDLAMATSLKQGVAMFSQEFGFLPPLVNEIEPTGPLRTVGGRKTPWIYSASNPSDATFLRTRPPPHKVYPVLNSGTPYANPDLRFSLVSIPYYIIGALEAEAVPGELIDGVAGPGFLKPKRDGSFERAGRKFDSFYDLSKNSTALIDPNPALGRVLLRDANGVPVRYYRWLRGNPGSNNQVVDADDCSVPLIAGRADQNPALRSADYAIALAGPDGVFGDEADIGDPAVAASPLKAAVGMSWSDLANKVGLSDPQNDQEKQRIRDRAMKDNVVEVGSAK